MKKIILLIFMFVISITAEALPNAAKLRFPTLEPVGKSDYTVFFMDVYDIWYSKSKTKNVDALHIKYHMDLTAKKRLDSFMESLKNQQLNADYDKWEHILGEIFPDVVEGDTISIIRIKNKLVFYHNNEVRAQHIETKLAKAFFNVWLGKTADEDMKEELLNK